MTALFHKYQSRQFQFVLGLMAAFAKAPELSVSRVNEIAVSCGLEYADQVLPALMKAGLVVHSRNGIRLAEGFVPVNPPMGSLEREYLQFLLAQKETELFLGTDTRSYLESEMGEAYSDSSVEYFCPVERMAIPGLSASNLNDILQAIREKRYLYYSYCTSADPNLFVSGVCVPWKVEYDTYSHRWWLIHYNQKEDRMIKSILNHIRDIRLGERADVTADQILGALERLLAQDEMVLRIFPERNALERCAMVFERQMLRRIIREPDGNYLLTFRYYKFDESLILRRLLYLGSAVQLLEPKCMCVKLLELIRLALES